jgi:hypothetical protein
MDRGGWRYPQDEFRVSDADRDQALSELSEAFQAGRITADEFEERSRQALAARAGGELTALLADLPVEHAPAARDTAQERAQRALGTRVAIGVSAAAASLFAFAAVTAALATPPALTPQQRETIQATLSRQGFRVPPGFPANPGFDWPGTIGPAVIAVLLVVVIMCLRVRLARTERR